MSSLLLWFYIVNWYWATTEDYFHYRLICLLFIVLSVKCQTTMTKGFIIIIIIIIRAWDDIFKLLLLSDLHSKTQRFTIIYDIEKHQIFTSEKLEAENVWHWHSFPVHQLIVSALYDTSVILHISQAPELTRIALKKTAGISDFVVSSHISTCVFLAKQTVQMFWCFGDFLMCVLAIWQFFFFLEFSSEKTTLKWSIWDYYSQNCYDWEFRDQVNVERVLL